MTAPRSLRSCPSDPEGPLRSPWAQPAQAQPGGGPDGHPR